MSDANGHASANGLISTISAERAGGTWATKYQTGGIFDNPGIKAHRSNTPGGTHKNYAVNGDIRHERGRYKKYTEYSASDIRHWDVAPPQEYFNELARVSKNQIIWGGNYFPLPPTRCFIVWKKLTIPENFTMAMAEYAWTSFNANAKVFEAAPQDKERFHITQKPVGLYRFCLRHFAKQGDKILDTHMGSQSSRIAAYDMGFDYFGCEIDENYFTRGCDRYDEHTRQTLLWDMPQTEQTRLL